MLQTLLLEEERDRHQNVDSHEGDAHEPMAGGVGRHKIDVQNAEDQRYHAEHVEVERHVVAGGPSDKHHDRNHTQRNLRVFHAGRRQQACRCGWADKRVDVDMHTRT